MKPDRRLLSFLLALLFVVGIVGSCAGADLIILHTNDIHGRIEIDDGIMGMPYLSSLIQYYRNLYEHVLVLDAGDTIHGRPITDQLQGESTVKTMNTVGYDAMAPGNHDFNFGYEHLLALAELMEFHLLAANVFKDGELLFDPYIIKEIGPYNIGIFGLATADTYTTTHPHNIVGIEFGDMVEAAEKYVNLLRNDYNVHLVIALGHVGLPAARDIAARVEGIDLFVDGHSHSLLGEGEWHNNTLIVQANEYSKYLGVVEIDLTGARPELKASLISARAALAMVEPDTDIIEMLLAFREEVRRQLLGF